MLWQYYGEIDGLNGVEKLSNNLEDSNLQWCMRGAKLSCFAVLEGESCKLFTRMANRASSLFNKKEIETISSRVVGEIQKNRLDENGKPTAVTNRNSVAVWLNYLLYHLSMVSPEQEYSKFIQPDPFSLSLLALEGLLENETIHKVDKSLKKVDSIQFKVALSFPGEKRPYVSKVVDKLRNELGKDTIFYDYDYQSQLARPNLDCLLQNIYRSNADLVVVFLCKEYSEKDWCGLEWRAVRDIIKSKNNEKIMFFRFDNAAIDGVFSIDGYIDANQHSEEDAAKFILERVSLSESAFA